MKDNSKITLQAPIDYRYHLNEIKKYALENSLWTISFRRQIWDVFQSEFRTARGESFRLSCIWNKWTIEHWKYGQEHYDNNPKEVLVPCYDSIATLDCTQQQLKRPWEDTLILRNPNFEKLIAAYVETIENIIVERDAQQNCLIDCYVKHLH